MLSARRRLLVMLLVLVAGAAIIATAKLAAWWVVVVPTAMLAGYLCLLRTAAKADAERDLAAHTATMSSRLDARMTAYARAAARRPEARGQPTRQMAEGARSAPPQPAEQQQPAASAEVVDISDRVAEPYDQYTDAELRAVGD